MKKIFWLLALVVLFGCATANLVYVNPQKTAKEIAEDKAECQAMVDASDWRDETLKQEKYKQCMLAKGYKQVPEQDADKVKGFKEVWVNPDIDFKVYEVILIDPVDVSQVKVKNSEITNSKVTDEEIDDLGSEMGARFSNILNALMPVVRTKEAVAGRKALYISLQLEDIAFTNIGFNAALTVVGHMAGVPIPTSSKGMYCFYGTITDFLTAEKLITLSDETKGGKNSSLVGVESFEKWQHAYNTMDYWADCLAKLLAAKRGEDYKSQLKFKLF